MAYGIGRIPNDRDTTAEAIAEFEAAAMQHRPRYPKTCSRCGCMARELMSSSGGQVCLDCYDDASD